MTEEDVDTRVCRNKECGKKGNEQPIENFPLNGDGKGNRRWQCRECMRRINRGWRNKNREKISSYNSKRGRDKSVEAIEGSE